MIKLRRKRSFTYLILDKLAKIGVVSIDAFFPAQYAEARVWRKLLGLDENYKFSKQKFSKIIHKLQNEGLVQKRGATRNAIWKITSTGKKWLDRFRTEETLPPADGIARLVIFDIPETEKRKREWLRVQLVFADYRPLQKSVWLGVRPLSERFMEGMKELRLEEYVHVLSVLNPGTLEKDDK